MSPLTIFKASAGSGKTFQLTMGYLELLFKNPLSYRHILAVTFTNKAAGEMKSRILDQLYAISRLEAGERNEAVEILEESTGFDRDLLVAASRNLLVRILNDYSRFSVGTIDRFFQGVIRSFTREIGLPAGFNLELDRDRILGEAVDRMFLELGEDKEMLNWMLSLAETRIEASRGWNFRSEIIGLGEELFTEEYQEVMLRYGAGINRDRLRIFMRRLDEMETSVTSQVRDKAEEAVAAIRDAGLELKDFHGVSRNPASYFFKAATGERILLTDGQKNSLHDISKWRKEEDSNQARVALIDGLLQPALREIYGKTILLNSFESVREYVYTLGILNDISERILDITDEKNLFLLSDASRFLKGLIADNPTPFIYEKTGSFIDHIMLDEFQDTSVFQWENFRPLLEHTLSTGKENIVVGDVKQSIYRWRNSDWKILADRVAVAFPGYEIGQESLDTNWRSEELIVRFNNTLFTRAPGLVRERINEESSAIWMDEADRQKWDDLFTVAYSEVIQKVPKSKAGPGGYVRAEILAEDDRKFKDISLERVPEWIRELQDAGYASGDIAILVKTNREGAEVARLLMTLQGEQDDRYNYNFVSNDSLFLDRNVAVKFITSVLKFLQNERDQLNNISLGYYLWIIAEDGSDVTSAFVPGNTIGELLGDKFAAMVPAMKRKPLFELVETIIEFFGLEKRTPDLPYIQAFQEVVLELQHNEPGSLHDFIRYWEEYGSRKSITVSEEQEAIRIITIHKAKGLQFKTVILPFCDWELSPSSSGFNDSVLWCNTEGTPFDSIPVVPVKFKKSLKESLFSEAYLEELVMGHVDSLNILYVALTRAEDALLMGIPEPDKKNRIRSAGQLVMSAAAMNKQQLDPLQVDLENHVTETGFELGSLGNSHKRDTSEKAQWQIDNYPVSFRNENLRLSLKSRDYFQDQAGQQENHLDFGNLMHEIFGMIRSNADVPHAIQKYMREGILTRDQSEKLQDLIYVKLKEPAVIDWFQGQAEVINERDIYSDGEVYRPDRVMIMNDRTIVTDYKFGDAELASHERQVRRYASLLEEMGYRNVEGYIWYVMVEKVIKVV